MGSMTVQALRDYTRNSLDSDATEFSDVLCDAWRDEAIARMLRAFEPWSFLEKSYTFTSDGSPSLTFASIGNDLESITNVKADRWLLQYTPHEAAVQKYAWSTTTGGLTVEFSTYGGALFLWPTPSAGAAFVVEGHRAPVAPVAPTDVPDMPSELHPLIAEYMLCRALEKQGDFFISPTKFQRFEQELDAERGRYLRGNATGVQAIGQGESVFPFFAERLSYPWE